MDITCSEVQQTCAYGLVNAATDELEPADSLRLNFEPSAKKLGGSGGRSDGGADSLEFIEIYVAAVIQIHHLESCGDMLQVNSTCTLCPKNSNTGL